MIITLKPEQETWLKAQVEIGDFTSVEEAVRHLIDERIAVEHDDLAWVKPLVDEARDAVARGDVITLEEHRSRNALRLAALKRE